MMNIKTVLLSLLFTLPFSLFAFEYKGSKHTASCSQGGSHCKLVASGTVNLVQAKTYARTKNIYFTINKQVNGVLRLYYSQANNKDTVKGEFIITNTARKNSHIHYRVVFKDNIGIVAQSKGDLIFARGKNQKMKFGSVVLTEDDMRNIDTYNIKIGFTG